MVIFYLIIGSPFITMIFWLWGQYGPLTALFGTVGVMAAASSVLVLLLLDPRLGVLLLVVALFCGLSAVAARRPRMYPPRY